MSVIAEANEIGLDSSEKMSDPVDVGSMLAEIGNAHAVAKSRKEILTPRVISQDFDGVHCVDCDDAINPGRIEKTALPVDVEIHGPFLKMGASKGYRTFLLHGQRCFYGTDRCIHCMQEHENAKRIKSRQFS